jgi:predicted KAP-like P-loop ATPase
MLFQLVKANADFPKLIYFLLFQRDIVEKSVEAVAPITGREYLEKIVQVGLDVPRIERHRLERTLFAGLDASLGQETIGKRFNNQRWQNMFLGGLRPYFRTLRDVHRYIAVASFHVSVFRERGSLNVNPIDLIALEVLRVFDPEIYQALADNKFVVTGQGTALSRDWGDEIRKWVSSVTDKLPEVRREQVREILKQLFPQIDWALSNYGYGSGFEDGWMRDVRVCHPNVFDRYFHFTVPEGDISQAELELILR